MKARFGLVLALVAALAACGLAARQMPDIEPISGSNMPLRMLGNMFRMGHPSVSRGRERGERDMEDTAYGLIRFYVPPSSADAFEERWLDLEKDVDKEKKNIMFDLKRSKLTNVLYMSYGEWEDMYAMHDHFTSRHFDDFAEWVDKEGITWTFTMLGNESEDVEEDAKGMHRKGRRGELGVKARAMLPADASDAEVRALYAQLSQQKDLSHVIITYFVPPGEAKGFINEWTKLAENTVEEDGNRIYSLRRSAFDNTKFYAYGTWDSMKDYIRHLESKHLGKFLDAVDDHDVVFFINPLEKIGKEEEGRRH